MLSRTLIKVPPLSVSRQPLFGRSFFDTSKFDLDQIKGIRDDLTDASAGAAIAQSVKML